jgi:pyrroline-5-carboxylate reductase
MQNQKIAFLGCGNMGTSLISGLIANGHPASSLSGIDPDENQRRKLAERHDVRVTAAIAEGVPGADVIVLAVKPQTVTAVLAEVKPALQAERPLVLSIAAGVCSATISKALGGACPVVRAMPNTPALLGAGASGLYAAANVSAGRRRMAMHIMQAVGVAVWVDDEALLDTVTAVSGSGPAYFFLVVELLEKMAAEMGLSREQAHLLSVETAFGAARMLKETGEEAATLRQRVTSPGGTTEKALQVFRDGGLEPLWRQALAACRDRSVELAKQGD